MAVDGFRRCGQRFVRFEPGRFDWERDTATEQHERPNVRRRGSGGVGVKRNAKLRVKPRLMKKKLAVPIYDAVLWIVVTDNIAKERRKWEHLFGPAPDGHNYDALCSYSGGHNFALFFERESLTVKILSHEVFHLTHRIMDWVGANFDANHHEQGALLHGYLMDMVCREMGLLC
jgi:hypothetical protein